MIAASDRVALVHERITEPGGSERVVEQLHTLFPDAPIHVGVLDPDALPAGLRDADIRPTPLQALYRGGPKYAYLLPLLPLAMRHVDLRNTDLVITSHHAFSNRVRPPSDTPVVSYTHTPARWLWEASTRHNEIGGRTGRAALTLFAASQRRADRDAAQSVTGIIANSTHVAKRIRSWWRRDALVVPPPVNVDQFTVLPSTPREDFFLLAGRLVPYKRPDVAVRAAQRAGARLVIAGEGRIRPEIEAMAGSETHVLGPVDDDTLRDLYRHCRALVFPGEEDFGIVPVEAQACGAPVLAPAWGGVIDSVVDGVTGSLYPPSPHDPIGALADAMATFQESRFDAESIRHHAEAFSPDCFRTNFAAALAEILQHADAAKVGRRLEPST